jgi:alkylation response protein AidB-like acyl-CoA dehydrogenase
VPDRAALRLRPGPAATRAEPQADGSYALTGTKIFITAGEHDLTDNIVHLVLARLPDAPAGTKGISLFIVPKFKVGARRHAWASATRCAAARSNTRWASTARPPA